MAAARLAARHQSAQRFLADSRTAVDKAEAEAARAAETVRNAEETLVAASEAMAMADDGKAEAVALAEAADEALISAEEARAVVQDRESEARAARSSAEGEAAAIRAEVAALAKLVQREATAGSQLLDQLTVEPGLEKALGAALGVSRSAVWKQLQALQAELSLPLHKVRGRGYQLATPLQLLDGSVSMHPTVRCTSFRLTPSVACWSVLL